MPEALPLLLDYCVYAVRNQSKTAWLAESRRMSDRKILDSVAFPLGQVPDFHEVLTESGDVLMASCNSLHFEG